MAGEVGLRTSPYRLREEEELAAGRGEEPARTRADRNRDAASAEAALAAPVLHVPLTLNPLPAHGRSLPRPRSSEPRQTARPASASGRRAQASFVAYHPCSGWSVTPPLDEWTNQPLPT